ncbi:MAG: ANTAR domain-containing protein [Bacilli bacterium]|nr:ANTAR domain-containing protein [Bacilli bacterium]
MLKEIRYEVLVISSSKVITTAIMKNLADNHQISSPTIAEDSMNARRLLLERHFDIVIINSPLEHESALSLALEINDQYEVGIMLLTKANDYDEVFDKTNELGIITLSKPTPSTLFSQSIKILCLTRQKLESLKKRVNNVSFKDKLREIKLINEAKVMLIKKKGISEDDAHHYIERKAMNERISKIESALLIIEECKK